MNRCYYCLFLLFFMSCQNPEKEAEKKTSPNIIFILADDLGYGDIGPYGQSQIQTPILDNMAAEGIRFTQHYSGSTVCAPSRSCLMTGQHTGNTPTRANENTPLKPEVVTLAELLKEQGYATGLVGKWGLGEAGSTGTPNRQGFDYFFGFLNQIRAHNYYPDYVWRNEEKVMLDNEIVVADSTYAKGVGSAASAKNTYVPDLYLKESLGFIERSKDQPFFLYLAHTIPHANNEYWITSEHGMEVPDYGRYADKDWPNVQKGAAAMITRLDHDIGVLMAKLKELGLDENTLVIFTSDNGPHQEGLNDPTFFDSNGPLKGMKRDLYDGGVRVPMIARWPEKIPAGKVSDHISAFWDFLPTACDVAGADIPSTADGISYLPTLTGNNKQAQHEYLYWEFFEQSGKQSIRQGDWKGIRVGLNNDVNPPMELYDLSQDLGEENDVSASHPEIVAQLHAQMQKAHSRWEHRQFLFEKE